MEKNSVGPDQLGSQKPLLFIKSFPNRILFSMVSIHLSTLPSAFSYISFFKPTESFIGKGLTVY